AQVGTPAGGLRQGGAEVLVGVRHLWSTLGRSRLGGQAAGLVAPRRGVGRTLAGPPEEGRFVAQASTQSSEILRPYAPRLLIRWLAEQPHLSFRTLEGSMVFVDISGFTKMSERLARHGKVGAEEVTEVLGAVFAKLLAVAYGEDGSLLKFGGDALLLWFSGTGHAARAATAAHGMRGTLRSVGRLDTTAGKVVLRMSVGVNSEI